VLRDLEDEADVEALDLEGGLDGGELAVEADVDDGADDLLSEEGGVRREGRGG
jgi:hypothetical protein